MKVGITGHMVVHNEEQWVWYTLMSVLPYLDKIIIFDTGSTDQTLNIIKSITSSKIYLEERGPVNSEKLVQLRNEQIEMTKTDWFMLIDGDEVWPKETIEELVSVISHSQKGMAGIVVHALLPLGDLFHFQEEIAGKYALLGRVGHYNLRAYKKVSGFHWEGIYPHEAYTNATKIPLQKQEDRLVVLTHEYWHLTHLRRSSVDTHQKLKLEIGEKRRVTIPEIFNTERPSYVPSPWVSFTPLQKMSATFLTPLRKVKRAFEKKA